MSGRAVHTAGASADGGGVGTDDGRLQVSVVAAGEDAGNDATTPEHLMAAALATCLQQAVEIAASSQGLEGAKPSVSAQVSLTSGEGAGYDASFELTVTGLDGADVDRVVEQAAVLCPFTTALAGDRLVVRSG